MENTIHCWYSISTKPVVIDKEMGLWQTFYFMISTNKEPSNQ